MENQTSQPNTKQQTTLTGVVDSLSGAKTIRVTVSRLTKHPIYGKYVRRRTRLAVHDPNSAAKLGDTVEIIGCRRISKNKSWRLVRVLREAGLVEEPSQGTQT